jgi:hypothetical protein
VQPSESLAARCPLPAARCPLPAARCPLPAARCPLPAPRAARRRAIARFFGRVFIVFSLAKMRGFESFGKAAARHGCMNSLIKRFGRCNSNSDDGDEFVAVHLHPLNKSKKSPGMLTGIKGKFYGKYDRVSPILDSMREMYDRIGWLSRVSNKFSPLFGTSSQRAKRMSCNRLIRSKERMCINCSNENPAEFRQSADGEAMVCAKCGVVGDKIFKSQHREKNCIESEDKTIRADPIYAKKSRFDECQPTASEARKRRENEHPHKNVFMNRRTRQKMGVGYAQEMSESMANKTGQYSNECLRGNMDKKEMNREAQILYETEELIRQLGKIHDKVASCLRRKASDIWLMYVQHTKVCPKDDCTLTLGVKGQKIIAESIMWCVLQGLAYGEIEIAEVEHPHVVTLNDTFNSLSSTDHASAAKSAMRAQVMKLLQHDKPTPFPPCKLRIQTPSSESSEACVHDVTIRRCDSSFSDLNEEAHSDVITIRNNILQIHKALASQIPRSVKEAALGALSTQSFKEKLYNLRTQNEMIKETNLQALSLAILSAGHMKHDETMGSSSSYRKMPQQMLQSCGLSTSQVEKITIAVADIFPTYIKGEANPEFDF